MLDTLCSIGGSHQPLTFVIVEGVSIRVDKAMLPYLRKKQWVMRKDKRPCHRNNWHPDSHMQMHKFVAVKGGILDKSSKSHSIHHVNDNKYDNRLCNLKVYGSFREHRATHHKHKKGKKKA